VAGTNNPAQTAAWAVEGGSFGTGIAGEGLLAVGADETAASLTIRAASSYDATKSGAAAVTV
jgi:hypothetical protein